MTEKPDLEWKRGSSFWSCTHKHSKFQTFRAEYSDSGVLTISIGDRMVRHQKSNNYGSAQVIVRRCFLEYLKDGIVPPRMSRSRSISGL